MTSVYDPAAFAQMTFSEANSTESFPIPEGEHLFTIDKYEVAEWKSKDNTKAGLKLLLTLSTSDAKVCEATGRTPSRIKYDIMLDLTETGHLDMGKGVNVQLGRARDACGLNIPGRSFSFDQFVGQEVKGLIFHEIYQERPQARVKGIAKAQ